MFENVTPVSKFKWEFSPFAMYSCVANGLQLAFLVQELSTLRVLLIHVCIVQFHVQFKFGCTRYLPSSFDLGSSYVTDLPFGLLSNHEN